MAEFTDTAYKAANSLMRQAELHGVNLKGLTIKNFNTFLDDAFNDGGEIRCLKFTDLIDPYACQFGPIESEAWEEARWPCIERAIQIIQEKIDP